MIYSIVGAPARAYGPTAIFNNSRTAWMHSSLSSFELVKSLHTMRSPFVLTY